MGLHLEPQRRAPPWQVCRHEAVRHPMQRAHGLRFELQLGSVALGQGALHIARRPAFQQWRCFRPMASAHSLRLDAGGQLLRPLMAQSANHRAATSTDCVYRASVVVGGFIRQDSLDHLAWPMFPLLSMHSMSEATRCRSDACLGFAHPLGSCTEVFACLDVPATVALKFWA